MSKNHKKNKEKKDNKKEKNNKNEDIFQNNDDFNFDENDENIILKAFQHFDIYILNIVVFEFSKPPKFLLNDIKPTSVNALFSFFFNCFFLDFNSLNTVFIKL